MHIVLYLAGWALLWIHLSGLVMVSSPFLHWSAFGFGGVFMFVGYVVHCNRRES
ncbi:hypothetical protein AB8I23_004188 [Vibrio alginolyticus]|nr:hypothetical protein [Vibrio parahaemolyticus]EJC7127683.1 hypothetical protein [Vibrio parahaemolyticus]